MENSSAGCVDNLEPGGQSSEEVEIVELVEPSPSTTGHCSTSRGQNEHKKSSDVHQHYIFLPTENKFKCKYCKTKLTQTKAKSTTNLWRHYNSTHKSMLKSEGATKGPNVLDLLKSNKHGFSQAEFESSLIDFILQSNQPFTIVEDESFRRLILLCNPSVNFIAAKTVKQRIVDKYEHEKKKMFSLFQEVDSKISFVLDCWTSSNQIAFQGVIGQWIDSDWKYQERIIDLDILKGRHTGSLLSKSFLKILKEFDLLGKIMAVTTDNASNCDTFFEQTADALLKLGTKFDINNQRVRCLAHITNLACQDAIATIKCNQSEESDSENDSASDLEDEARSSQENTSIFQRLRKGIINIRKSTQRRETFRKHCELVQMKHKELVKDVKTRWNSSYFMLKRALKMKVLFENTLRTEAKLKDFLLSEDEWKYVDEIVAFLKPFKKMTIYLSRDKIPTMSLSVMVYMELFNHLESITVNAGYSALLVQAAERACTKLNKYYPRSDGLVFVIGTILDPRCKISWYTCNSTHFPANIVRTYKSSAKKYWEDNYKPKISTPESTSSATKQKEPDQFLTQMKKAKLDKRDEFQIYLEDSVVRADDESMRHGVLGWWKVHQSTFPNLSKMARDFLAVSGTGVPIERFFSHGPDLLTPKRQSMLPETVRKCMCLRGWMRSENQEDFRKYLASLITEKMFGSNND